MKDFLAFVLAVIIVCSAVVGIYYIAKHLSYSIWYEDMVIDTVVENVKEECLK